MSLPSYVVEPVHELLASADPQGALAPCGIRRLVLGRGALDVVPDTLAELLSTTGGADRPGGPGDAGRRPRVALLVDPVRITRHGADVKEAVRAALAVDHEVEVTVLDDGHHELHVVDEVVATAREACTGADAVVAVGAGTVSDIAKLAAVGTGGAAPVLVVVQTAASVDGFTDDVSVVLRDGVKRTVPSRWPDAVVSDAETIAEAPAAMNRAGFGEMTSMLVAPADWRLAQLVGVDDAYHEAPVRLLHAVGSDLESWAPGVAAAAPDAVASLTRALALRGVVTGVSGTTAVLSGVEHLVSHMLDQHHAAVGAPTGLHGAQVGVGGVVSACAWELLDERLTSGAEVALDARASDPDTARGRVLAAFSGLDGSGGVAEECWGDYSRKLAAATAAADRLLGVARSWGEHRAGLQRLVRSSDSLATALVAAGAPATFGDLTPSVAPDLARWAVANCHLMRNRFTVVDLLALLGWWGLDEVDEVLTRAAAAVAAARAAAGTTAARAGAGVAS